MNLSIIAENWSLLILITVIISVTILLIAYRYVLPGVINIGYKRALSSKQFQTIDGSEGAGSIDIKYYNLYFDVSKKDVTISGQVPEARYWQFGAFDGSTRLIDGAFLNHKTMKIDEQNRFEFCLTARPHSKKKGNIMDCSSTQRGMIIYRIVLPQNPIVLPIVK